MSQVQVEENAKRENTHIVGSILGRLTHSSTPPLREADIAKTDVKWVIRETTASV